MVGEPTTTLEDGGDRSIGIDSGWRPAEGRWLLTVEAAPDDNNNRDEAMQEIVGFQ
jgi:hypothetical protein